jgi:hypothetical protein
MPFPFEVPPEEVQGRLEEFVDATFDSLKSEFMSMPRSTGYVSFELFDEAYEALKKLTGGFADLDGDIVLGFAVRFPVIMVVLRAMLGFTPPEWAYETSVRSGVAITESAMRSIDRRIRLEPKKPLPTDGKTGKRIAALVRTACALLVTGVPEDTVPEVLHRLDKVDTRRGLLSTRTSANVGISYSMLLYERFMGRPFAGYRDSVSELVGDVLEGAIEEVLNRSRVSHHKTRRAERIEGFDQAPDFIIPNVHNPKVIIEAKLAEDPGTARDKVTRIVNLVTNARQGHAAPAYQVVACLAGRGFKVRREDMRRLLTVTGGKVFTLQTVEHLIQRTDIARYICTQPEPPPEPTATDLLGERYDAVITSPPYSGHRGPRRPRGGGA